MSVKELVIAILLFLTFPQIFLGKPYGFAAFYFSLGIIVYMMATGYYPFMCKDNNNRTGDKVYTNSIINHDPDYPEDFIMDLKDLIERVSKHPFVASKNMAILLIL